MPKLYFQLQQGSVCLSGKCHTYYIFTKQPSVDKCKECNKISLCGFGTLLIKMNEWKEKNELERLMDWFNLFFFDLHSCSVYTQLSHLIAFVCTEYVNAQDIPTDMKSITDRAAQTLLWTELFRGQLNWTHVNCSDALKASCGGSLHSICKISLIYRSGRKNSRKLRKDCYAWTLKLINLAFILIVVTPKKVNALMSLFYAILSCSAPLKHVAADICLYSLSCHTGCILE